MKFFKGQKVRRGSDVGIVQRMFGNKAVQVRVKREKLILAGFPARPAGTEIVSVLESWAVHKVIPAAVPDDLIGGDAEHISIDDI